MRRTWRSFSTAQVSSRWPMATVAVGRRRGWFSVGFLVGGEERVAAADEEEARLGFARAAAVLLL